MAINKNASNPNIIPKSLVNNKEKVNSILGYIGIALVLSGAILLFMYFKDILFSEVNYVVQSPKWESKEVSIGDLPENIEDEKVMVLNKNFGIYIPKIGANAKVVKDVDPFSVSEYTNALYTGVAHSKTSVKPGENGNVFIFAHSAVNFYESRKYNVYFYLLNKLNSGDLVYISYKGKLYKYSVEEVKTIDKGEISYLGNIKPYKTLTLMTCWPAGMDIKRVVVIAKEIEELIK